MELGVLIHATKAVGHALAGDIAGAAIEGGKAILSVVAKDGLEFLGETDWAEVAETCPFW